MKKCSKCLLEKKLTEFSKQSKCNDGLNYWCKSCYKSYREINKDRIKISISTWQKYNPDKCNANTAKWAKNNLKKCAEKAKRWREKNPEKARKIYKNYRENNKEKTTSATKRWIKNNKYKVLIMWRNRHARKKCAEGSYCSEDINKLLINQKYKCNFCYVSVKKKYHVDHIYPLSKGGSNWPENLQILCPTCNLRKNDKDPIQFANENGRLF